MLSLQFPPPISHWNNTSRTVQVPLIPSHSWRHAGFQRQMQKHTKGVHHECKKALEAKYKEQTSLSSLPAVLHASFPLLCPGSDCCSVRSTRHHLQWSSPLSRMSNSEQAERRKIPYFLHIASWAGWRVMGKTAGGRFALLFPVLDL